MKDRGDGKDSVKDMDTRPFRDHHGSCGIDEVAEQVSGLGLSSVVAENPKCESRNPSHHGNLRNFKYRDKNAI